MGRYIQWDDVVNRYKRYGDIVTAEESQESFVQYAEAYVDGLLGVAFTAPFSSNNVSVRDLCIDIAFAKTQMFKDTDKADAIMSHVHSYAGALVSGNMAMLTDAGAVVERAGEPVYSQTMGYTPVFGKGIVEDFKVDSSQIYDEEQARD